MAYRQGPPHPGYLALMEFGSTQTRFCREQGFNRNWLSDVFGGRRRPTPQLIEALSLYVGKPPELLFPLDAPRIDPDTEKAGTEVPA